MLTNTFIWASSESALLFGSNPGRELGVILSLSFFSLSFVTPGVAQEEAYHTRTWIQNIILWGCR
jgi:hypothetical protein